MRYYTLQRPKWNINHGRAMGCQFWVFGMRLTALWWDRVVRSLNLVIVPCSSATGDPSDDLGPGAVSNHGYGAYATEIRTATATKYPLRNTPTKVNQRSRNSQNSKRWLIQRWPNVGTKVPTLGKHWANPHCSVGSSNLVFNLLHLRYWNVYSLSISFSDTESLNVQIESEGR